MIPLFDVRDKKVVPSIHCFGIPWLKKVMDSFPDDYIEIYKYIFYLTCPDSTMNPYLNLPEEQREEVILADLKPTFYLEDLLILETIEKCKTMYATPALRSFIGAKKMVDKIGKYLDETEITEGKDSNSMAIDRYMSKLSDYWDTYRKMEGELHKEQSTVRGGVKVRYDQLPGYVNTKE